MRPFTLRKYLADCIRKGINLNNVSNNNESLLHYAVDSHDMDMIVLLVTFYKVNIDQRDINLRTPLYNASMNDTPLDIIKYLLDRGSNPNATDEHGRSIILNLLLNNIMDSETIKILLDYGADRYVIDNENLTPLQIAYVNCEIGMVYMLLQNKTNDLQIVYPHLSEFFMFIIDNGPRLLEMEFLLDEQLSDQLNELNGMNQNMLHFLILFTECNEERYAKIAVLIMHGININHQDFFGNSPLMLSLRDHDQDLSIMLLQLNCEVEIENFDCVTPLSEAVKNKMYISATMILDRGGNANDLIQIDVEGVTIKIPIITFACGALGDNVDFISALLDSGANINAYTDNYFTPLTRALSVRNFEIAIAIFVRGGDLFLVDGYGKSPMMYLQ